MKKHEIQQLLLQHSWENVKLWDSIGEYPPGVVYLRMTHVGASAIFVCDEREKSILDKPEVIEPRLLRDPHRIIGTTHIMDLLYFSDFSMIETPPRLCFHDPNREFGITLNFPTTEEMRSMKDMISKVFTTEMPTLPGFFRIARFCPPIGALAKKGKETTYSINILQRRDWLDSLLELRNSVRGKPCRTVATEQEITDMELPLLLREKTVPEHCVLDVWLKLSHLPSVQEFGGSWIDDYSAAESQWMTRTVGQLNRSKTQRDMIERLTEELLLTPFPKHMLDQPDDFLHKFSFEILMTVAQIDPVYNDHLSILLPIFVMIIVVVNPVIQPDGTVKVNDRDVVDRTKAKAISFWLFLGICMSAEHGRLFSIFPGSCLKLFEDMRAYLVSKNPVFEALDCGQNSVAGLVNSFLMLFCDVLDQKDCCDLWSVGLACDSVHEIVCAFLCVCCALIPANFHPESDAITWVHLVERVIARENMGVLVKCAVSVYNNCCDEVRQLLSH